MAASESAAITNAIRTSRRVKPRSRATGDANSAGQPVDADLHPAFAFRQFDGAAGRTAVRVEADGALVRFSRLAGNGDELEAGGLGQSPALAAGGKPSAVLG